MFLSRTLALFTALALLAGRPAAAVLGTGALADFPLEGSQVELLPDLAPDPLPSRPDQEEAGEAAIALEAWLADVDNAASYAGCYITERNTLRILLTDESVRTDLAAALADWEGILEYNFVAFSAAELESWAGLLRTEVGLREPCALYSLEVDQKRNLILVYVHADYAEGVMELAESLDLGRDPAEDGELPFVIISIAEEDLPVYRPAGRVLTDEEAVLEVVPGRDGHHMVVLRATGSEELSYGAAFHVSRLPDGADPEDEEAWLPVPTRMPHFVIDILYHTAAGEAARYDLDSGLWMLRPGGRCRLTKEVMLGDDPEPCLVHAELPEPWRDPAEARWNRQQLLAPLPPGVHLEPEETPFFAEPEEFVNPDQSRALAAYQVIADEEAILDVFLEGERLVLLYADEAAREELEPQLEDWEDIIDWQPAFYYSEDLTELAQEARKQLEEAGPGVLWRVDYDTRSNRVLAYVHADRLQEAVAAFLEIEPDFAVPEEAPPPLALVPLSRADLFWQDAPEGADGSEIGVTLEVVAETGEGLTLRLRNGSEKAISFGEPYRIERRVQAAGGELWEVVPNTSGSYAWNDLLCLLEPGGNEEFLVRPGDWLLDPGQSYRVARTIMLDEGAEESWELRLELPQLTPESWNPGEAATPAAADSTE